MSLRSTTSRKASPVRPSKPRREGAAPAPLSNFLAALATFLEPWRARLTDPLGLALVASLDALLRRLEEVRAHDERTWLTRAHQALTGTDG